MLVFILVKRSVRRARRGNRRATHNLPNVKQPSTDSPLADAPPDLLRWQVEMHDTARNLKGELDSKMSALQALVIMARQEIVRLDSLLNRAAAVDHQVPSGDDFDDDLDALPISTRSRREAMKTWPYGMPGDQQQRSAVFTLADQGNNAKAIADRLGVSIGDIEMILGCRASGE